MNNKLKEIKKLLESWGRNYEQFEIHDISEDRIYGGLQNWEIPKDEDFQTDHVVDKYISSTLESLIGLMKNFNVEISFNKEDKNYFGFEIILLK